MMRVELITITERLKKGQVSSDRRGGKNSLPIVGGGTKDSAAGKEHVINSELEHSCVDLGKKGNRQCFLEGGGGPYVQHRRTGPASERKAGVCLNNMEKKDPFHRILGEVAPSVAIAIKKTTTKRNGHGGTTTK